MARQKHHHDEHSHHQPKRKAHKDWRIWTVVGLMLASMVIYVLTMDESWQPFGGPQQQLPATPDVGQ